MLLPAQSLLKRLQVEPTNRCNFRCIFCRRTHWQRKLGDMPLTRFREVLNETSPVEHLHLQGQGEPLLHEDFPAMVKMACLEGISVGTTTNVSLMTPDLSERILDAGIKRINLSLDTVEPESFGKIRPGACLETILGNIEELSKIRALREYDVSLAIAVVAMQSTAASLPAIVNLACDFGLDEIYVQNLNSDFLPESFTKTESCLRNQSSLTPQIKRMQKTAERAGVRLLLPPLHPNDQHRCGWPLNGCYITWDGYVVPCCLQPDPGKLNFGNIFEENLTTIREIAHYSEFRKNRNNESAGICTFCPDRTGQMWHPEAAPF